MLMAVEKELRNNVGVKDKKDRCAILRELAYVIAAGDKDEFHYREQRFMEAYTSTLPKLVAYYRKNWSPISARFVYASLGPSSLLCMHKVRVCTRNCVCMCKARVYTRNCVCMCKARVYARAWLCMCKARV